MFCVGLTGNIASGKSTAAAFFAALGIEVISADSIARHLTQPGEPAFEQIIDHFGQTFKTESGDLDRRKLRELIFNHPKEKEWLESLLHPLIRKTIADQIKRCQSPYCMIEIPLLPNKKDYPYLDRILFIQANSTLQIQRLMARDNTTHQEALSILSTQANESKHLAVADDILVNHGSEADLKHHVSVLHQRYLEYAHHSPRQSALNTTNK